MDENNQPISNAFTRMLQEFRQGSVLGELSEAMQNCVAAARETGKAASFKYEMKFEPSGDAIVVTDKLDEKIPQPDRRGGIFFPDENNNLLRDNPAQRKLDLKTVENEPQQLKQANA